MSAGAVGGAPVRWAAASVWLLCLLHDLKVEPLMGDAVSTAVMPGVVIAYALNLPFRARCFVFGVGRWSVRSRFVTTR